MDLAGPLEHPNDVKFEERPHRLDARFHAFVGILHERLETLVRAPSFTATSKPKGLWDKKAVYLFSNGAEPFYIGRTRNLAQRIGQHCNAGSQPNQSSIAFYLACKDLNIERKKYTKGQSWKQLLAMHSGLDEAFGLWKCKMRAMCIRYVEESDPIAQALLEIYCSVALRTPYNDFDTH